MAELLIVIIKFEKKGTSMFVKENDKTIEQLKSERIRKSENQFEDLSKSRKRIKKSHSKTREIKRE